jgi:hypothetical protein
MTKDKKTEGEKQITFLLVPPLIRIHRQMVGGYNGSFAILDCTIEAFPLAVHYWERHDGRLIQSKKVFFIFTLYPSLLTI